MMWTIRRKVTAFGALTVLALSILIMIALATGERMADASATAREGLNQFEVLGRIEKNTQSMNLLALNAIAAREDGTVSMERRTRSKELAQSLRDDVKAALDFLTGDLRKKGEELASMVDHMASAVVDDLPPAIEGRDGEEIDGLGHRIEFVGAQARKIAAELAAVMHAEVSEKLQSQVEEEKNGRNALLITFVAAIAILSPILLFLGRSIVSPIDTMTAAMGRLAEGDLGIDVPGTERSDEIGRMAAAVAVFKTNSLEIHALREREEAERRRAAEERKQTLDSLAKSVESSVGKIVDGVAIAVAGLRASAESLSGLSEQARAQTGEMTGASERAAVNVDAVAAATRQLEASITEIAVQMDKADRLAKSAVGKARAADQLMGGMADAAKRIGNVVQVISAIAHQTNLLALNATIEATAAGEAGRGFAVVAAEVKNLANQTAKATEEISSQIVSVQDATTKAVAAIQDVGGTIDEIGAISTAINAAVEEQGAATRHIGQSAGDAAQDTRSVAELITGVAATAKATNESAVTVLAASRDLSRQYHALEDEVRRFVEGVRAA